MRRPFALALALATGSLPLTTPARAQELGAPAPEPASPAPAPSAPAAASPPAEPSFQSSPPPRSPTLTPPPGLPPLPPPRILWRPTEGPGDPEAKADFQHVWLTPDPSPTLHVAGGWFASLYGIERFDYVHDSTQSFSGVFADATVLQRPGTYRGDHDHQLLSVSNSRYGLKLGSPGADPFGVMALLEVGIRSAQEGFGARHAFVAGRTPIVDVLVGRYHDLFGWGGRAFFPATVASLGVPGEIFRQREQLRLTHVFRFVPVDFEIALAAMRPVESNHAAAEGQLGFRLAVNGWVGAAEQAAAPATLAPLQIGLSFIGRRFVVPLFRDAPGTETVQLDSGGAVLSLFLPLIPARTDDLGNALSLTLEASRGSGIGDLYSGFTSGAIFPVLPNPDLNLPPVVYAPGIQPGLVTFDRDFTLRAIEWSGLVASARYHVPLERGRRVWVSSTWSRRRSDNLLAVTPPTAWSGVVVESHYFDANAFVMIWRGLEAAISYQVTQQTFGVGAPAENRRVQVALAFSF